MPNTPNTDTPPPTLGARIREILHGRSKYALAGGAALLIVVIAAGAMSRHTSTPRTPPVVAHAARAAAPAKLAVAARRPATPPVPRPAARVVATASAPPAPPAAAPAANVAAPTKPAETSAVAVAQPATQPTALVSAAMPKPPSLVANHALKTSYDLSAAAAWVQTSSTTVALPRSSFVVHASTQATRVTWAAWFKVSKPTTVLTLTLAKSTDGDITVGVDGFRAFHVARGAFALTPRSTLVSPFSLAPGWHELAVSYSRKWGWRSDAQITLAAGGGVAAPVLLNLNAAPVAAATAAAPKTTEAGQ